MHLPTAPGTLHVSHPPAHAESQQAPSAQFPLAHAEAPVGQDWPFLSLHAPTASQVFRPVQVTGSSALVMLTQAPVPATHDLQTPEHVPEQQIPLTQTPEPQSSPMPHVAPGAATSKISALAMFLYPGFAAISPPITSTLPEGSGAAVEPQRVDFIARVGRKLPVTASYTSALAT